MIAKITQEVGGDLLVKCHDIKSQTHFHDSSRRAAELAADGMMNCFFESMEKHLREAKNEQG